MVPVSTGPRQSAEYERLLCGVCGGTGQSTGQLLWGLCHGCGGHGWFLRNRQYDGQDAP